MIAANLFANLPGGAAAHSCGLEVTAITSVLAFLLKPQGIRGFHSA
jgi:hypothetical protein